MPARVFYFALFAAVLLLRLCHSDIVWVEEGYPLAAAAGLATLDLYRDEGLFERARALGPMIDAAAQDRKSVV